MSGIAGLMTRSGEPPPAEALRAMAEVLGHRGPDGEGRYRSSDLGMVQTRLATIDLETGDQPLYEPSGAVLVADAAIYNHLELRREFPAELFSTRSDCELPLHLYRRHGLDFSRQLRGIYGLALYDPAAGSLVLARDPFGIKPLYYSETGAGFAFASEPSALLAAGIVPARLLPGPRNELLQMQFTTGRATIFAGIDRVLPGESLLVRHGRIVERRRREALPPGGPRLLGEEEALALFDAAFEDSVSIQKRSDVPVGVLFWGDIHSTALLTMMARIAGRAVSAFTLGFAESGRADQGERARAAARAVGAEHIEIAFGERDFWHLLPGVVARLDDPAADLATLETYALARAMRAAGLKVILCGEGGDELFAGYGRYRSLLRPWWAGGRVPHAHGTLDGLGVLRAEIPGWRDGIAAAEARNLGGGRTALQVAQAADCAEWLPNDLLIKLDRALMAHGSEGRTPFLDPLLAAFALSLPDGLKIRNGLGKWLLRRWLAEHLPASAPFVAKRGLGAPVGRWIARRGIEVGRCVAASPAVAEICEPEGVLGLFTAAAKRRAGRAAWTLLFYALWHRRHIEGERAPPQAIAALAEKPAD
jgi:asparagine synthase (glutamine-hydrolysing)